METFDYLYLTAREKGEMAMILLESALASVVGLLRSKMHAND